MAEKILIFGATGAVGSSLANLLRDNSKDVHLIGKNQDEISSLADKTGFSFSVCDVLEENFIENEQDVRALIYQALLLCWFD